MARTVWYGPHEIEIGSVVHKRLKDEGAMFTAGPVEFVDPDADVGEREAELADLKREDLDLVAIDAGVDDPEKLPNKGAVITAILEAEAAGGGTLGE